MEKDSATRYADGADLLQDLNAIAQGLRTEAGKPLRRRVSRIDATGAVCMVALAASARWFFVNRQPARLRVAVADFTNETEDKDLSGLSGMLITSLEQSQRLSVLTRGRVYELLGRMGESADRIDEPLARELAKRTPLTALVLASIRRFGDLYVVDVKILDPSRNDYVFAVKEQGRGLSRGSRSQRGRFALPQVTW